MRYFGVLNSKWDFYNTALSTQGSATDVEEQADIFQAEVEKILDDTVLSKHKIADAQRNSKRKTNRISMSLQVQAKQNPSMEEGSGYKMQNYSIIDSF